MYYICIMYIICILCILYVYYVYYIYFMYIIYILCILYIYYVYYIYYIYYTNYTIHMYTNIYTYTGFFPWKYYRAVSLLKIEFSFPSSPCSGHGQEPGAWWLGVQWLSPRIVLNFTPSRRQETASPVLKSDSVDTVFTFYYARKMQPATLNSTFRAVLHIQQPFYFISFISFFKFYFLGDWV